MNVQLALGKACTACGKKRKIKVLLYDPETLNPFCENPYICNDQHPNHPINLIKRGRELELIDFGTASEAYKNNLIKSYSPEHAQRISNLINRPINFRINDPEVAQFLMEFMEDRGFDSVSETMRYCIQVIKENRDMMYREYQELRQEHEKEEQTVKTLQEIESPATPATTPQDDSELEF